MKRLAVVVFVLLALAGCKSAESELVGLWVTPFGGLRLAEDGTGKLTATAGTLGDEYEVASFTWTAGDGELCLTLDAETVECGPYALEGERLAVNLFGDEMQLERRPTTE